MAIAGLAAGLAKGLLPSGKTPEKKVSGSNVAQKLLGKQEKEDQTTPSSPKVPNPVVVNAPKINFDKIFEKLDKPKKEGVSPIQASFSDLNNSIQNLITTLKKGVEFKQKNQEEKNKRRLNLLRGIREATLESARRVGSFAKGAVDKIPFLDRVMTYLKNVLLGSIFTAIAQNLETIVKSIQDFFKKVGEFFKVLNDYVIQPLWNALKWVAGPAVSLIADMMGYKPDPTQQRKIEDDLSYIMDQIPIVNDLVRSVKNMLGQPTEQPSPTGGGGTGGDGSVSSSGPLAKLISSAEGGVNSVNRGTAGDTPGGAKSILGKNLTEMTVDEVYAAQRSGKVFAVGKHQIIPITMPGFIKYLRSKGIDTSKVKYDEKTQDMFMDYVVNVKRPEVGRYLRGETDDPTEAGQELAREYASLGLQYPEAGRQTGESRYAGTGGNRASVSNEAVIRALRQERQNRSFVPPSQRQPGVPGQSKVETDILEFRKFRSERFGASAERTPTSTAQLYQIREMGVYGSGNYNISPLADDTSYEIGVHRGAGHHENRAFDIPVPISSAEGDAVAHFWRSKGYRTIWNNGDGIHHNHVHVEVPKHKADEFYRIMQKPKPKPAEVSSRASYEGRQVAMVPLPVGGGGGVTPVVVGGSSGQPQRPSESNKASLLNNYQNAQMMSTLSRTA